MNLLEELSRFVHEDFWSHWMKYFVQFTTVEKIVEENELWKNHSKSYRMLTDFEKWDRWGRQMNTLYKDLPEEEKQSDRELAAKLLQLFLPKFSKKLCEHLMDEFYPSNSPPVTLVNMLNEISKFFDGEVIQK